MNISIPSFVEDAINEISSDSSVSSIWLVGSRANGSETDESDWDVLYFSCEEPEYKLRRSELIDVIHVGPSNQAMTYGVEHSFSFDNWKWNEIDVDHSTYVGEKFIEYPDSVRDTSDPRVERRPYNAYCLWRK